MVNYFCSNTDRMQGLGHVGDDLAAAVTVVHGKVTLTLLAAKLVDDHVLVLDALHVFIDVGER